MNRVTFLEKSSEVRSSDLIFSSTLTLLMFALCLFLSFGCDRESKNESVQGGKANTGGMDAGQEMGGMDGGMMGGMTANRGDLYLTYTRVVTEEGNTRGDLLAFNMRTQSEMHLNEGMSQDDIDCLTFGCAFQHQMNYVAWIKRVGTTGELWLAPVDKATKKINITDKIKLSDTAVNFSFSGTKLFFSEVKDPSARQGNAVKSVSLEGGEAMEHELVDDNGGFSIGLTDDIVIIIKTDLSSMTLTYLNTSTGQVLELITLGTPGGTGSEFSASSNPVNIAPQYDYFSIVTSNEFMWRLNTFPMMGGGISDLVTRDLFPVPNSDEACTTGLPFTQVLGAPKMSPDGERLYLLFGGDCSQRENPSTNRRDYDIYRFNRDLSVEPLNVTRIVSFNGWSNHDISNFAVTPDESKVAFVATRPNQSGVKGIWLQEITEGSEEDPTVFDCSLDPNVNPMIDITMQRRCEYIVYETQVVGATVEYRTLNFITAEGF